MKRGTARYPNPTDEGWPAFSAPVSPTKIQTGLVNREEIFTKAQSTALGGALGPRVGRFGVDSRVFRDFRPIPLSVGARLGYVSPNLFYGPDLKPEQTP
ncbi:MAG: hypothetical protein COA62_01180 [Rhodobiaceae bacterium]|nr:MAG: hypothetical protein COA62_01180 [Rhodobiaceae bacterium]